MSHGQRGVFSLPSDGVIIKILLGGNLKTHLIIFMMYNSQKSITDQGILELPTRSVKVFEHPNPEVQQFWCWGIEFVRRSQNGHRLNSLD